MQHPTLQKLFSLTLLLVCSTVLLPAQELRENEKGEKIIVFPDGSWQYFLDFGKTDKVYAPGQPATEATQEAFPTFGADVQPLNQPILVTEEELRKIAVRKSQISRDAVTIATLRAEEADRHLKELEKQLKDLRQHVKDPALLAQEEKKLQSARQLLADTQKEVKLAEVEAEKMEGMIKKGTYVQELARQQSNPSSTYGYASLDQSIAKMIGYNLEDFLSAIEFIEKHHSSYNFEALVHEFDGIHQVNKAFTYALNSDAYRVGIRL